MEPVNIILCISNLIIGLLLVLLSIPLKRGSVKMNVLYGVRFKKSFESEENWYKINKYGAERFMLWSLPIFAIGFVVLFIPFNENLALILLVAHVPVIVLLIAVVETYQFARKL